MQVETVHYSSPFFMFFGVQAIINLSTKVTKGSKVVRSNFNLSTKHTRTFDL